jgi:putative colanic acid biosynthesis acetyltransferase WcaF
MPDTVDISANRVARKWSRNVQAARVAWSFCEILFRVSPRPFHGFRCALLRLFGARIGRNIYILPSVRVTMPWNLTIGDDAAIGDRVVLYALGPVSIGTRVTISQHAHLCAGTHDWRDPAMPLLKPPITIGDDVWVCADAFVGPGVTIMNGAIVGARAVIVRDVAAKTIVAGNPARQIGKRDQ